MKLIPLTAIGVSRNGEHVRPVIGQPFEFNAAEKADLDRIKKDHGIETYRLPVNEVADKDAADQSAAKSTKTEKAAKVVNAGQNSDL